MPALCAGRIIGTLFIAFAKSLCRDEAVNCMAHRLLFAPVPTVAQATIDRANVSMLHGVLGYRRDKSTADLGHCYSRRLHGSDHGGGAVPDSSAFGKRGSTATRAPECL
jgi:hypothetical protein